MKHREGGLTMVEVVFAIGALSIVFSVFISMFVNNFTLNTTEMQKTAATRILEETFESYRKSTDYASLRQPISTTRTVDNVPYTINSTFCPSDAPTDMACSPSAVYIRVEVRNEDEVLQTADTYYARFGSVE